MEKTWKEVTEVLVPLEHEGSGRRWRWLDPFTGWGERFSPTSGNFEWGVKRSRKVRRKPILKFDFGAAQGVRIESDVPTPLFLRCLNALPDVGHRFTPTRGVICYTAPSGAQTHFTATFICDEFGEQANGDVKANDARLHKRAVTLAVKQYAQACVQAFAAAPIDLPRFWAWCDWWQNATTDTVWAELREKQFVAVALAAPAMFGGDVQTGLRLLQQNMPETYAERYAYVYRNKGFYEKAVTTLFTERFEKVNYAFTLT